MDIISVIALFWFFAAVLGSVIAVLIHGTGWFWGMRLWLRLTIVASVVCAGILAVYGAADRAERREPTFDVAHDRVWPTVPLGVSWNPSDLGEYNMAIVGAMKLWNDSVGCPLFAQAAFQQQANVRIVSYDSEPCGMRGTQPAGVEDGTTPGVTWPCPDGTDEIQVNRLDDIQKAYRVIAHELGHTLRLAHDEPGGGIMAPAILDMNIVEPNRKDVLALRARYCAAGGR